MTTSTCSPACASAPWCTPSSPTTRPVGPTLQARHRYVQFHRHEGNDPQIGLRLSRLLRNAGLTVLDHTGTFSVISPPPGLRPPSWAARGAMVAAGLATPDDVARWQRALERLDAQPERPTMFVPQFTATGRRPG